MLIDEISRRARAMEIIGFQLELAPTGLQNPRGLSWYSKRAGTEQPLRIPADLRLEAGDIRDQLKRATDRAAVLIGEEKLTESSGEFDRHRQRDLIYAPIWAPYDADRIINLLSDPAAKTRARTAYETLQKIAGASQQLGVHPDHRLPLRAVAEDFKQILSTLKSLDDPVPPNLIFYFRMENCYARLLSTRIARQSDVLVQLDRLANDYRAIASDFPMASIPHFRLNIVLSELKQIRGGIPRTDAGARIIRSRPVYSDT